MDGVEFVPDTQYVPLINVQRLRRANGSEVMPGMTLPFTLKNEPVRAVTAEATLAPEQHEFRKQYKALRLHHRFRHFPGNSAVEPRRRTQDVPQHSVVVARRLGLGDAQEVRIGTPLGGIARIAPTPVGLAAPLVFGAARRSACALAFSQLGRGREPVVAD